MERTITVEADFWNSESYKRDFVTELVHHALIHAIADIGEEQLEDLDSLRVYSDDQYLLKL